MDFSPRWNDYLSHSRISLYPIPAPKTTEIERCKVSNGNFSAEVTLVLIDNLVGVLKTVWQLSWFSGNWNFEWLSCRVV